MEDRTKKIKLIQDQLGTIDTSRPESPRLAQVDYAAVIHEINSIEAKMKEVQFDNIQDISRIAELKAQIIACRKMIGRSTPTIFLCKANSPKRDITGQIKESELIGGSVPSSSSTVP